MLAIWKLILYKNDWLIPKHEPPLGIVQSIHEVILSIEVVGQNLVYKKVV